MKSLLLFIILGFVTMLSGQDMPVFREYNIEEFVEMQFLDSETFYKSYYTTSRYPIVAREKNIEGTVEVLMINHSDTIFETFIAKPEYHVFLPDIHETMMKTRNEWLHSDLPFILRFCVEYDLISSNEAMPDSNSSCKLKVEAYRIHELRDTNYIYNIDEISYYPQIYGYPYFGHPKRIVKQYHPIESIEELIEEAVKSCCHKAIQLKKLAPIPPHSQGTYTKPKGYMQVIFHSKGYISKVQMYGNLVNTIDAEALFDKLKDVQFRPALLNSKPVHVRFNFTID